MFEHIARDDILFAVLPGISAHVWLCGDCKLWHTTILKQVIIEGVPVGIQELPQDDWEDMHKALQMLARDCYKVLRDTVNQEAADLLVEMYGVDFSTVYRLYQTIKTWAEKEVEK